jgi:hypothetical protein
MAREPLRGLLTSKYLCRNSLAGSVSNIGQCCDLKKDSTEIDIIQFIIIKDSKGPKVIHQITVALAALLNELCLCHLKPDVVTSQEVPQGGQPAGSKVTNIFIRMKQYVLTTP